MASWTPHHLIISSQGANQKQNPFAPSFLTSTTPSMISASCW